MPDPADAPAAPTPIGTFAPAEPRPPKAESTVPLPVKVAAGTGEACINIGVNIPKNLLFPVYNIVLGVNPTLLGIALFVPRLWDAVLDPLMGSISDNSRGRFGRRRPYMLVGGLLTALAIGLLCVFPRPETVKGWVGDASVGWFEFGWDDAFYAVYLMVVSMLFYACLTVFAVPYGALTMEMTRDYDERTRVMSFRTLFTYVSGLLIGWLYAIAQADWDILKRPGTDEIDPVRGTYAVGILLVVVILVCALLPTLFVREPHRTAASNAKPKINVWEGLKESLRSKPFLLIIAAYTVGFLGVIMVIGLGQYVCYYHVYGGDQTTGSFVQGWAHTFAVLMGILATFLINRLSGVFEKKTLLLGALASSFLGGLLSWFLYDPGFATSELRFPPSADAGSAWLNISFHPLAISYALIWPGLAGLLILSNSMIADLCDVDELNTGQRREGMYWAVFNWIQKTAISIALLFSGVILDVVGFDGESKVQTESTIFQMRLAYVLVVCGGVACAAVLVWLIPLSRERMEAVRAQLAERGEGATDA